MTPITTIMCLFKLYRQPSTSTFPKLLKLAKLNHLGGQREYQLLFVTRKDYLISGKPPRLLAIIRGTLSKGIQSSQDLHNTTMKIN